MKCPKDGYCNQDGKFYPQNFSEWSDACQDCENFQNCFDKAEVGVNNLDTLGDNYPTYENIHLRLLLNKERKELIEKLELDNLGTITKDEILDIKIDLWQYNKNCKYKKRVKKYEKK